MNAAGEEERLPHSVSGLFGFALRSWAAYAPLFVVLAIGVFGVWSLVEYLVPAAAPETAQGQFKAYTMIFASTFGDAFVIAAVALGVAARLGRTDVTPRALLGIAVERWLPVIAVSILVLSVQMLTDDFSGLGPTTVPRAVVYVTAPIVWIMWAAIGLAPPLVALDRNRTSLAVLLGFVRAFTLPLRPENLIRLCILAVVTIAPNVLAALLQDSLAGGHLTLYVFFWSNAPIDALTVGPLAAIQTVFALDFARRAGVSAGRTPGRGE